MKYNLEQHIFTSAMAFETAALSPGIDRETLAILEANARNYTDDKGASHPPEIVRGFPLPCGERWVVALFKDTGPAFNRGAGNYLAHSFVLSPELVRALDWGVAWVAVRVGIWDDYKRVSLAGPDRLDPLPFETNPEGQFRFVRLLVQEMPRDAILGVASAMLGRLSGDGPRTSLAVHLPPPHVELPRLFGETFKLPDGSCPPLPSPDRLRLLRVAGLLALLPRAFRKNASFAVNEPEPLQRDGIGQACAITVLRTAGDPPRAPPQSAWLEECIILGERDELGSLQRAHEWLSAALAEPSVPGLEHAFRFYKLLVAGAAEGCPSPARVEALLTDMATVGAYDVGTLFDALHAYDLVAVAPDVAARMRFWAAFARVAAACRCAGHAGLVEALCNCLEAGRGNLRARVDFFRSLPFTVQARVWDHADAQRRPPAYPCCDDAGRPDREDLALTLRVAEPSQFGLSRNHREAFAARILGQVRTLSGVHDGGRRTWFEDAGRTTRETVDSLLDLGAHEMPRDLAQDLAEAVAAGLPCPRAALTEMAMRDLLEASVTSWLARTPAGAKRTGGLRFLADLVIAFDRAGHRGLPLPFVYHLTLNDGTRELVRLLVASAMPLPMRRLLAVDLELRDIVAGSYRVSASTGWIAVAAYTEWLEHGRDGAWFGIGRRNEWEEEWLAVHAHLADLLNSRPVSEMLRAAAAYLAVNPGQGRLFRAVQHRLQVDPGEAADALARGVRSPGRLPLMEALAWIIVASGENRADERFFVATLRDVLDRLDADHRQMLFARLDRLFHGPRFRLKRWVRFAEQLRAVPTRR